MCLLGAIAVTRGAWDREAALRVAGTDLAVKALQDTIGGQVALFNDGHDRLVPLMGPPRRWWLRRRALRALKAAARRCRRG